MNPIYIRTARLAKPISCFLFVVLLSACGNGDSNTKTTSFPPPAPVTPSPSVPPVTSVDPVLLKSFSMMLNKGESINIDMSPYVSSEQTWALTAVTTDNQALAAVELIDSTSVAVTGVVSGMASLVYTVSSEGVDYEETLLLAVNTAEMVDVLTVDNVVEEILSDGVVKLDLRSFIHGDDDLKVSLLPQSSDRFGLDGFELTYSPSGIVDNDNVAIAAAESENGDFIGDEAAFYSVEDAQGNVVIGRILMVVSDAAPTTPNVQPIASADIFTLNQGELLTIDVTPLVSDADGDDISLTSLYSTSGRAVLSKIKNKIIYTPELSFTGSEYLLYVVSDGKGGYAQAEIKVAVAAIPDPDPVPDPNPTPTPALLSAKPLVFEMNKGDVKTFDIASAVTSNSDYHLVSVNTSTADTLASVGDIVDSTVSINALEAGIARFIYTVAVDGVEPTTSEILVAIHDVETPNTAPTVTNVVENTLSNALVNIDLSQSINDDDGDTYRITAFSQTADRFAIEGTQVTYTPNGFVGDDAAFYAVEDARGGLAIGRIVMIVANAFPLTPNALPVARPDTVTLNQGESLTINVTPLVSDTDGDDVILTALHATSGRAIKSIAKNRIVYTPRNNFFGLDSFLYVVSDGKGGYAQAEINVEVNEVIEPKSAPPAPTPQPIALSLKSLVFEMNKGDVKAFDIASGVTSSVDYRLISVKNTDGLVSVEQFDDTNFTVKGEAPGIATVTYEIENDDNESNSSVALIAVSEPNNATPEANNITDATTSDTAIVLDLASLISDSDNDPLSITSLQQVGNRFVLADKQVTYTPSGFVGVDSATYLVEDARGGYALGLMVVNVADANPVIPNNVPTAQDYTQSIDSDTTATLDLVGASLIADTDGDSLTVSLHGGNGRATVTGSVVTYVPDGYIGVDEVVYAVDDGQGGTAIASWTLTVSDANKNAPTADTNTVNLTLQEILTKPIQTIDILGLVNDVDGDTLKLSQVYGAANKVVIDGDLTLSYTPSAEVTKDVFTYVVSDSKGGFAQNTITVIVNNQAPIANSTVATIDPYQTESIDINLTEITDDPNADDLTFVDIDSVAPPATLVRNGDLLTYRPNGVERREAITYTVTDGQKSDTNVITIVSATSQSVLTANPIPWDEIAMDANEQVINVSGFVDNLSNTDFKIEAISGARLGTTALTANPQEFTYKPKNISYGTDTFYYVVSNDEGHSATGEITISLTEPAAPVITDLTLEYGVIATLTCSDCDESLTDYQFYVAGVPVGTNQSSYDLTESDRGKRISVLATAKNKYCTEHNTGVSDGNACKVVQGRLVADFNVVETVFSTEAAFAALKTDGTVATWGESDYGGTASAAVQSNLHNVEKIFANAHAFAALKKDRTVVVWGHVDEGGSNNTNADLTGINTVYSTNIAFAALKDNKTVEVWGKDTWGGQVPDGLNLDNIEAVYSTSSAFAALNGDGKLMTWGDSVNGGDSTAVQDALAEGVIKVFSNSRAFAAVKDEGSTVVTWGNPTEGADTTNVNFFTTSEIDSNVKIDTIFANDRTFAALKTNGNVVVWGRYQDGGDSEGLTLTDIKKVYSTLHAFAGLTNQGKVLTWGLDKDGGYNNDVSNLSTKVVTDIYHTTRAFAALTDNGEAYAWGEEAKGGSNGNAALMAENVKAIYSNEQAFAAIKDDGSVITWGNSDYGGALSNALQNSLINVSRIYATNSAFIALKKDGTVVTWGDSTKGGNSGSVSLLLAPIVTEVVKDLDVND